MVLDHIDCIHVVEGRSMIALLFHEYTCLRSREVFEILHGAILHLHIRSPDICEFLQLLFPIELREEFMYSLYP